MHLYFVGLDVHKQVIAYCVKTMAGEIVAEGKIAATRAALDEWVKTLPGPWHGGMEATMFSHWIYHHLKPHAARLQMGHAARMKAISAGKKKNDKIDARTIADLLRCNLFPECFVISPELGALRQQMRFRRLVIEQEVMFKNKTAGLLMGAGVSTNAAVYTGNDISLSCCARVSGSEARCDRCWSLTGARSKPCKSWTGG